MFRVAVAFLKLHEAELLAIDSDELIIDALKSFAITSRASDIIDISLRIPLPRAKLAAMLDAYRKDHAAEFASRERSAMADAARKEELHRMSAETDPATLLRAAGTVAVEAMEAPSPTIDSGISANSIDNPCSAPVRRQFGANDSFEDAANDYSRESNLPPAVANASKKRQSGDATISKVIAAGSGSSAAAVTCSSPPPFHPQRSQHFRTQSSTGKLEGSMSIALLAAPVTASLNPPIPSSYAPIVALPLSLLELHHPPDSFSLLEGADKPHVDQIDSTATGVVEKGENVFQSTGAQIYEAIEAYVPVYLVTPEVEITLAVSPPYDNGPWPTVFADTPSGKPASSHNSDQPVSPPEYAADPEYSSGSLSLQTAPLTGLSQARGLAQLPEDIAVLPDDYYRSSSDSEGNEDCVDEIHISSSALNSAQLFPSSTAPLIKNRGKGDGIDLSSTNRSNKSASRNSLLAVASSALGRSVDIQKSARHSTHSMQQPARGMNSAQPHVSMQRKIRGAPVHASLSPPSPRNSEAVSNSPHLSLRFSAGAVGSCRASIVSSGVGSSGIGEGTQQAPSSPRGICFDGGQSQGGRSDATSTATSYSQRHQHSKKRAAATNSGHLSEGSKTVPSAIVSGTGKMSLSPQQQANVARRASAGSATPAVVSGTPLQPSAQIRRRAPPPVS